MTIPHVCYSCNMAKQPLPQPKRGNRANAKRKTAEAVVVASEMLQDMTWQKQQNPGIGYRVNPKKFKDLKTFMKENVK